jgi:phage shock protein C
MLCPYCRTENRPGATRCAACTSWLVARRPVDEWQRARSGTMLGGVCRGLATRLGLPVAAVRLAFVVGTILVLWGAVVYAALWIIMPREPVELPPPMPTTVPSPAGGWPPPPA